jgi:MFS family permease
MYPVQLSISLNVDYDQVSGIPTLVQAGYAASLLLISPPGDLVRRRLLMLLLVFFTTAISIGLAVIPSLAVFECLSFLAGVFSVVPQILMPLAADLAPPHRRGAAISLVLAGLLCGVLYAQVISGIIAEFTSWRVVYYIAIGIQAVLLLGMYAVLPDYPAKNPDITFFTVLFTMAKLAVTEPTLIQACLINIGSAACFSSFWDTLTFLLGSAPYNYSTYVATCDLARTYLGRVYRLAIDLVGFVGVALAPFVGRLVDRLVPWYATLVDVSGYMLAQAIQMGAGGVNIAAVVIACIGLDLFRQMILVGMASAVYAIDEKVNGAWRRPFDMC